MNAIHPTQDEIEHALAVIQEVFRSCRPYVLERAGKSSHTDKKDGSPVTAADLEVEKRILAAMAKHFPGVPVYGEETGYGEDLPEAFWLFDPIDGTQSFVENVPSFTSMAVLIQGNEAAASIIYNISTDDMYVAQKDKGAYKNGTRLDLSKVRLPRVAYCKERFFKPLDAILEPKGVHCENGPSGGGFGFTLVADGLSAARFNMLGGGYIHDYAPGALLVREAGGAIVPIKDDVYTYKLRSFVACHPELEPVLLPRSHELRGLEIELADK
ncbi:MAG TPA: inositol monophosphatase family protein [Bacillota bacterium]|nr:inositol monophosphatase family protein [Bacillota bacterium]